MSRGYEWIKFSPVMRRTSLIRMLLVAAALSVCAAAGAQQLHWFNDYPAARDEARKTGKPIFLAFRCAP